MTELEKMLAGKIYDGSQKDIYKLRLTAHKLCKDYNDTYEDQTKKRAKILKKLLPNIGEGTYIQGPIQFDYGVFTTMGKRCYVNFNWTVLDVCPVTIGDDVFIGPNCAIMTPVHPLLPHERNIKTRVDGGAYDDEYAKPIKIGSNCWLASNVTVCAGVTIGEGCVIGAGSVVTRDIPSGVFAAGNPCRVIRKITEGDSIYLKKELW